MLERRGDQAEGLRRLLRRGTARVLALASASAGGDTTPVATNLAAALAERGLQVALVDARGGAVAGPAARQSAHCAPAGVTLLAHAACAPGDIAALATAHDCVLIDCGAHAPGDRALRDAAAEPIVLAPAHDAAIVETYALIKRSGARRVHLLLQDTAGGCDAVRMDETIRRVAKLRLGVAVESLGCVPRLSARASGGVSRHRHLPPHSAGACAYRRIAAALASGFAAGTSLGVPVSSTNDFFAHAGA